jgi:hypothetical protein
MQSRRRRALVLTLVGLLPSCGGSNGGSGGDLTIDIVCAPTPCDSSPHSLLVTEGNRDALPVGQSLRFSSPTPFVITVVPAAGS